MEGYLNFPSAVVKIDEIKALGVMIERIQIPTGMSAPSGQTNVKIKEIPLLVAYTPYASVSLGQVRDHETAIEVKDLFFALCQGNLDPDGFHEALHNLSVEKEAAEAKLKIVKPTVEGNPELN